ncbi:hypothetical protein [Intestinibacter sp.]
MKYTIMGFSQKAAFDFKLDLTDLCILRWFVDFKDSGNMRYAIVDGEKYYWIFYKRLIEEICILYLGKSALYKRLKKLCDLKILKRKTIHFGGNYSYFALAENYKHLVNFDYEPKISPVVQTLTNLDLNLDDFYYDNVLNSDESNQNYINLNQDSSNLEQDYIDFSIKPDDFNRSNVNPNTNIIDFNENSIDFNPNCDDFNLNTIDFSGNVSEEGLNLPNMVLNPHDSSVEQIINPPNKSNKLISINETSAENFLSQLLYCLIKKNNPNFDVPDFNSWTKGFSIILKNDKRSLREVIDLLRWIHLQDDFWRSFVLSPWDLRKQYGKIVARKKYAEDKAQAKKQSSNSDFLGYCDVSQFDEI